MIINDKNIDESKLLEKKARILLNTHNYDSSDEFIYLTEILYQSSDGEYILHTMWLINDLWAEPLIKSGQMSPEELEPQEKYEIISEERAQEMFGIISEEECNENIEDLI